MRTVCQPVKPLARGMDKEASKIITASLRVGTKQRVPTLPGLLMISGVKETIKRIFSK